MLFRLIKFAFQSLWRRKLRTILSIFGISIGIILITIMVSLGIGLQEIIVNKLRAIPTLSAITVTAPENTSALNQEKSNILLNNEIKRKVESIQFVKAVHPIVQFYALLSSDNQSITQSVLGLDSDQAKDIKVSAGAELYRIALENTNDIVLASSNLKNIFGFEYPEKMIGKTIFLKTREESSKLFSFRIIGIIDQKSSPGAFDLIMPLEQALNFIGSSLGVENFADYPVFDRMQVEVDSFEKTEEVAQQIKSLGLEVITLEEIIKKVVKYFRFFELGLGVFGFIVLAVASMGIMNMMIMSIYERTREIGVLKAVGARAVDIVKIFSLEAGLVGLIGGCSGVLISYIVIFILQRLANFWMKKYGGIDETIKIFSLPVWLIFIIIIFAVFIGFISGLYPAIRAARMDPAKALREK